MPVRSTMAALIAEVRLKIGDPTGASATFTDQQIQDHLDKTRTDVRYEALRPAPTYTPSGVQYNDYYSTSGYWEADETLIYGNYQTLTPTASDEIVGHWTFSNQYPPVFIAGKTYDVYRASADLLALKIASLALSTYDFTQDGFTAKRGTILQTLSALIAEYRRLQKPLVLEATRADLAEDAQAERETLAGPVSSGVPFLTGQ